MTTKLADKIIFYEKCTIFYKNDKLCTGGRHKLYHTDVEALQKQIDDIHLELLALFNRRARLAKRMSDLNKTANDQPRLTTERDMLSTIIAQNDGPLDDDAIEHIFKALFKANEKWLEKYERDNRLVSRKMHSDNTIIDINGAVFGNGTPQYIIGPCAVDSEAQVAHVAEAAKVRGLKLLRGGAFKPRTSPYDFQGLGMEGLRILRRVADDYDLAIVSEIVDPAHIEDAVNLLDVIQIGSRNMQNFELLKAVGEVDKPVLLKRGMSATIAEFVYAAEYMLSRASSAVIVCEREMRTYETATRNTLDISAVPVLQHETHLPVIVDVTHSTGRRDLLLPVAKAALAIGADGIMAEVHPNPDAALSDAVQQMDLSMFNMFMDELVDLQKRLR